MRVALIQMDIMFGKPEQNVRAVEKYVKKTLDQQPVDLFILPELWTTGYDLERLNVIADPDGEASIAFISRLAQTYQVSFIAGSIANRKKDGFYNTLLVIDANGTCIKTYDKAHLFRLMQEEQFLQEGHNDGVFVLNEITQAAVICYDIRFPEWIRTHMLSQAKVLYVVAQWPKARIDHWRSLLISRAIENQCYVVACNRAGEDPNHVFGGHSIIIGPRGNMIAEAGESTEVLIGSIDFEEVDRVRSEMPVFQDRRPTLYKSSQSKD